MKERKINPKALCFEKTRTTGTQNNSLKQVIFNEDIHDFLFQCCVP